MRVAFFTGGTVGAGHFVHGLALERALGRAGFRGVYRMFGPPLAFAGLPGRPSYEAVEVKDDARLRDPGLAPASDLGGRLRRFAPDLLLVDMFWAPLRWLLPALGCEAWLLLRLCPPVWLTGPPGMPFDRRPYRRVLGMEPVGYSVLDETVDPLVVANPDECRPPEALRERLGVAPGGRLAVVAHAGVAGEAARLEQAAGEPVRLLDLFEQGAPFPAAEWLGGADLVVSGGGYNAFWEAHWLGYAGRSRFVPFARSIDDQAARCRDFLGHRPRANGADTLARQIVAGG